MGKYGQESRATAIKILKRNMCHFIGTDVHKGESRVLNIRETLDGIASLVGDKYQDITINNPKQVISDGLIEPFEIVDEKQSLFKKLRKLIG